MDQKKKAGLWIIGFAAFLVALATAYYCKGRTKDTEPEPQNVIHDVPDGEVQEVTASKSDAYMSYTGSNGIEDYWNDLDDDYSDMLETEPEPQNDAARQATAEDLFGSAGEAPSQKARSGGSTSGSTVYHETAREREERHQKRKEEAIELASDIQKRQMGAEEEVTAEDEPATPIVPRTIELSRSGEVRRTGAVSSLSDGWDDGGISSLDSSPRVAADDGTHPFKCMFVREEKIKTGQRVSIRLLEDMLVGNTLIPKNSHLMATCSIGGRLELEISNVEIQGRIFALGYEAYDTDGTKGIYCPDSGGNVQQAARSRGTTLAGTALRSRVGRVAGDIVSTGISLIESSNGERTVTVPSGYEFFIVRKKNP